MNILFITNHLNTGGITSYVLTLASGLRKKGHNVYIASSGGERAFKFKEEGMDYIPIPMSTKKEISLQIIFSLVKLSSIIKKNKIDILHSHSRTTQVLGCLLEKITGAKHIFTCHGFFKRRLLRRIFPCWGEKVIAISEQVRGHLVKDFELDDKKIVVIHNGIDLKRFQAPGTPHPALVKKQLGLSDGPVIGIIARLSDVKGHQYLIEAMKTILEKYPAAQLLIIGRGKTEEKLIRLAASLGISSNVFFIPETQDTASALAAMDGGNGFRQSGSRFRCRRN